MLRQRRHWGQLLQPPGRQLQLAIYFTLKYTHTHTHTHMYIYIYIERENEVKVGGAMMGQDETRTGGAAPGTPNR